MRYEVPLPKLGENSDDSATVTIWLAEEDEIIQEDDDLLEMQTDKAAFTVPSPKTGTLAEKLVIEDEEVPVGAVLCILDI